VTHKTHTLVAGHHSIPGESDGEVVFAAVVQDAIGRMEKTRPAPVGAGRVDDLILWPSFALAATLLQLLHDLVDAENGRLLPGRELLGADVLPIVNSPPGIQIIPGGPAGGAWKIRVAA
jgi:hypothetical protein